MHLIPAVRTLLLNTNNNSILSTMENSNIDLAFEVHNYFSKNNLNNNDLSNLTLMDIHEHAKSLDRELSNYKRDAKYTGGWSKIRQEMTSYINHALGIK